jgi:hypothetical protein
VKPRRASKRAPVKVMRERTAEPRRPHEHDESSDSQVAATPQQREIGRKGLDDLNAGRVDTDLGPVLEELFRTKLQRIDTPASRKRRRR